MNRNVLLIVDQNFHTSHVGVRRVIQFYSKAFEAFGCNVNFGTILNGRLVGLEAKLDTGRLFISRNARSDERPFWSSGESRERLKFDPASSTAKPLRWSRNEIDPKDFALSLVTNPWILSPLIELNRQYEFSHGIVLDMVPNLLALGELVFDKWVDAFAFAEEHRKGYEYMTSNVAEVLAISNSTKQDFVRLTKFPESRVKVIVPFELGHIAYDSSRDKVEPFRILMVNALDHRKNFTVASEALAFAASRLPISLTIVGRERVEGSELESFLEKIELACDSVVWHREADDAKLAQLMSDSDLLFFPSKYEGLGLPILEAQAMGVPVLSDRISSCGEFNLNKDLTVTKGDANFFGQAIVDYYEDKLSVTTGNQLSESQKRLLANYVDVESLFNNGQVFLGE